MNSDIDTISSILRPKLTDLLDQRAHPKTICPSEVARSLSASEIRDGVGGEDWRNAMPAIRELAWRMRDEEGTVEILQNGDVLGRDVGIGDVRGPIRLRWNLRSNQDGDSREEKNREG